MLLLLTAAAIGAVVKFGLRSLLSLFGKLILLFDPLSRDAYEVPYKLN